jgi:hypothetical protein
MSVAALDLGPCVLETDVDDAAVAMLRTWLPIYMSKLELQRGMGEFTMPRPAEASITTMLDESEVGDNQLPAVLIVTGTVENLTRMGGGYYSGDFTTIARCISRGTTPQGTRRNVAFMGAAVKLAMTQHPDLGGLATQLVWTGGRTRPPAGDSRQGRYRTISDQSFTVSVDRILNDQSGPAGPPYDPVDPGGDPPGETVAVADVSVDVTGVPVTSTPGEDGQ